MYSTDSPVAPVAALAAAADNPLPRRAEHHPDAVSAASARRQRRGVHWWTATARTLAALLGGYWTAWGITALFTVVLPMARADRVATASLLSFAVWTAAALYAFAARSTWRAWWVLLLVGGVPFAAALAASDLAARP